MRFPDDGDGTIWSAMAGIGDLARLQEELTRAGVPVTVKIEGDSTSIPGHIAVSAHRIVQAALTNSLRHAAEALDLLHDTEADVVLMDVRMAGMDGIEATVTITTADSGPRVIILTTFENDDYVFDALRAGAGGSSSNAPPRRS